MFERFQTCLCSSSIMQKELECVCVCVSEREREREGGEEKIKKTKHKQSFCSSHKQARDGTNKAPVVVWLGSNPDIKQCFVVQFFLQL